VTVAVKVPQTVPLGSSRISLSREQDLLEEQSGTEPVYVEVEFESNKVRLENEKEYVFTALASADSLSVVDGTNPEVVVNDTSSEDLLLGRIPVGVDGVTDRPESLAITGDNSRIYVPLKFSGGVAVVDPITLSQVDNEPDTPDVEPIPLPDGARPQDIALGLRDEYAYIADERNPYVYVLDIDPFSDTYHEVLQTIVLETENNAGLNR
jgi:DNA-binding beta-propeller fold protein YncE